MHPPITPPLLPPARAHRRGLRARLKAARRRAAVVTSAALLSACAAPVSSPDVAGPPPSAPTWTASAAAPRPDTSVVRTVSDAPEARPAVLLGEGLASYYGADFAGNPTASGERFDPSDLTAAHRTLPFGTRVRVTNVRTGASVVVRINDRGPFHGDRVIDLSRAAADAIGLTRAGTATVRIERLPAERGARG